MKYSIRARITLELPEAGEAFEGYYSGVEGIYKVEQVISHENNSHTIIFEVWVNTSAQCQEVFNDVKLVVEDSINGEVSWHECWNFSETPQSCVISESFVKEPEYQQEQVEEQEEPPQRGNPNRN
jgi:hypothetical protein